MKVVAIIRAFYNGSIIKPGEILTIKADAVPSWAKKIKEGKEDQKQIQPVVLPVQPILVQQEPDIQKECEKESASDEDNSDENSTDDLSTKSEEELLTILEDLQLQGIEKDIMIDSIDKTTIEQINELKSLLKEPEGE